MNNVSVFDINIGGVYFYVSILIFSPAMLVTSEDMGYLTWEIHSCGLSLVKVVSPPSV